jgi:hypothetical protein
MGTFTDAMRRLRSETDAMRRSREAFISDLEDTVTTMRADFRSAHAQMAQQTWAERSAFVSNLRNNVAAMRAGFRDSQAQMAHQTGAERSAFVSRLRRTVNSEQRQFRADLAGGSRAWRGQTNTKTKRA